MKSINTPHRLLITGASGNLARRFITEIQQNGLRENSCQFLLTDLQAPSDLTADPLIIFEKADLGDPVALRRLVADYQPDFLVHFGSLLSGACEQNLDRAWQINGTASIALLEAAANLPRCTFFFPSTGATYGSGVPDPLPEDHPQWPGNFYGVAKVAVERAGVYLHKKRGLDFRCLRFPMVLSPSAPAAAVSAYASRAFVEARAGRSFVFPVSPQTGISTLYIKDAVEGIRLFLNASRAQWTRSVYNVHSFGPTAADIAAAIQRLVPGFRYEFKPDPFVDGLLSGWPRVHVDASARRDWGWSPRFDLEATAVDMITN
jgi:threonine 3-dehydrogenase